MAPISRKSIRKSRRCTTALTRIQHLFVLAIATLGMLSFTARAFGPVALGMRKHVGGNIRRMASVTGSVYTAVESKVVVTLYTKEGCTLCDKVKDVLYQIKDDEGCTHSLRQIDITDANQTDSFDRYKYDIPVLHIGLDKDDDKDVYWTKHRLTAEEAKEALAEAMKGSFTERKGRPNAAAMER